MYIEVIKELQNTERKKYRKINKPLTRNSKEGFIKCCIHLHTSKQQDKQTNNYY